MWAGLCLGKNTAWLENGQPVPVSVGFGRGPIEAVVVAVARAELLAGKAGAVAEEVELGAVVVEHLEPVADFAEVAVAVQVGLGNPVAGQEQGRSLVPFEVSCYSLL